jgi:hypothetical protein
MEGGLATLVDGRCTRQLDRTFRSDDERAMRRGCLFATVRFPHIANVCTYFTSSIRALDSGSGGTDSNRLVLNPSLYTR